MPHPIIWTLADWAAALSALPAEGPLPQRTVLVPSERPIAAAGGKRKGTHAGEGVSEGSRPVIVFEDGRGVVI